MNYFIWLKFIKITVATESALKSGRKLIKRAKFKHPTSSSQLVVGSDSGGEEKKKNVLKEATFKPVNILLWIFKLCYEKKLNVFNC